MMAGDSNEGREKPDNFRHALRQMNERLANRFVLKEANLIEEYLKGRVHIMMNGDFSHIGACNRQWLLRIEANGSSRQLRFPIDTNYQGTSTRECRSYENFLVFVDDIELMQNKNVRSTSRLVWLYVAD